MAIITSPNLPLETGTVVKIWHGSRGMDYVVAAVDIQNKVLGLIRATCINNDGSIHRGSVHKAFHKRVSFETVLETRPEYGFLAFKVSRVCGTRVLDPDQLQAHIRERHNLTNFRALKQSDGVYAPIDRAHDSRSAAIFG